jgi:exosortase/archaeosortase family protein
VTSDALPARGHRAAGHRSHRSSPRRRGRRSPPVRRQQAASPTAALLGRLLACIACSGLAITAVKENYLLRGYEALLASHVIGLVTARPAGPIPHTPTFWFTVGPHHEMGLAITPACTVVLMMTPFLVATAFLVWRKSSVVRPLVACAVAVVMLTAVNQIRIVTIVEFVLRMGYAGGFYWGHTMVGSLITIAGGSVTLIVYAMIAIRRGNPERGRRFAR